MFLRIIIKFESRIGVLGCFWLQTNDWVSQSFIQFIFQVCVFVLSDEIRFNFRAKVGCLGLRRGILFRFFIFCPLFLVDGRQLPEPVRNHTCVLTGTVIFLIHCRFRLPLTPHFDVWRPRHHAVPVFIIQHAVVFPFAVEFVIAFQPVDSIGYPVFFRWFFKADWKVFLWFVDFIWGRISCIIFKSWRCVFWIVTGGCIVL